MRDGCPLTACLQGQEGFWVRSGFRLNTQDIIQLKILTRLRRQNRLVDNSLRRVSGTSSKPFNEFTRYLSGLEQNDVGSREVDNFFEHFRTAGESVDDDGQLRSGRHKAAADRRDTQRWPSVDDVRDDSQNPLSDLSELLTISDRQEHYTPGADAQHRHSSKANQRDTANPQNFSISQYSLYPRDVSQKPSDQVSGQGRRPENENVKDTLTRFDRHSKAVAENSRVTGEVYRTKAQEDGYKYTNTGADDGKEVIVRPASSQRHTFVGNRHHEGRQITYSKHATEVDTHTDSRRSAQQGRPDNDAASDSQSRTFSERTPSLGHSGDGYTTSKTGNRSPPSTAYSVASVDQGRKAKFFLPSGDVELEVLVFYVRGFVDPKVQIQRKVYNGKDGYIVEAVRILDNDEIESIMLDTKSWRRERDRSRGRVPYKDSETAKRRQKKSDSRG